MSMKRPFSFFRPVKTKDGRGGSTVQLEGPTVIWGAITVHKESTSIHVDAQEDVAVNDVIEIEEDN